MQEREAQVGGVDIDVYVRCDSDPYGVDRLFSHLKIGRETVHREQLSAEYEANGPSLSEGLLWLY
jgi:hypothetical protein